MTRKLRDDIKKMIMADNQLISDYCTLIGISALSLSKYFERNAKVLTHHDAVNFLAKRLGKTPDEILTENSKAETKVMA
jgi:hypothetical protein